MSLLWRVVVNAVAIWVAVRLVNGLEFTGTWMQMAVVAGVLALVNALVRPVLTMLTCPLVLLTLGFFTLVINALMLMLTGWLSTRLDLGFSVAGFGPAFWGALIISIVSVLATLFFGKKGPGRDG